MLTIKQAAKKLGVHWQTVRNYIDRKELKAHKIGKLIKIKEEDLESFINSTQESDKENINLEIELRYKIKSSSELEKRLLDIGAKVAYQSHIIDHWFIPIKIKNREQHDIWFDQKRGCGIRIREQDNGYTGKVITNLETKRLSKEMNHNTFLEAEVTIDNYKKGETLLQMMDKKKFLTIDKNRIMYKYKNFKISIDEIKGYGAGVELELVTNKSRKSALKTIESLATKLKLYKKDMFEKSTTVDAMKVLAKFNS